MGIPIPDGGVAGVQSGFEPLPAGIYTAEVSAGELRQAGEDAKNPGSDYIAWELSITDEEYEGRKCWVNNSFVAAAKPMLRQFLEAVGYDEDALENPDFEIEIDDIIGRTLKVVLTKGVNPKTKEPNNSVRRVEPLSETESNLPG